MHRVARLQSGFIGLQAVLKRVASLRLFVVRLHGDQTLDARRRRLCRLNFFNLVRRHRRRRLLRCLNRLRGTARLLSRQQPRRPGDGRLVHAHTCVSM